MAFSLSNAISGAGGALADVAGKYAETAIQKKASVDLAMVRAEIERDRDARLHDFRVGEVTHQAETNLAYGPRQKVAEQEALYPGALREAEAKSRIAIDEARAKPRTLAPGSSEVVGGEITTTAPEKPHPREWLDYMAANARRLNAEAAAIDEGRKYRDKGEKPAVPRIQLEKDLDGNLINVDQNSGAIGVIIPGTPAKKGEARWFGPNDPDQPADQPKIEWSYQGKRLPGGLADLYPAMRERIGDRGGDDPLGLRGTTRPPLSSFGPTPEGPTSQAQAAAPVHGLINAVQNPKVQGEDYVTLRRGGWYVDAPIRSPSSALNGKAFPSREAALVALRNLYERL